ncbi:MAG: hypothetical protein KA712_10455 [Myxococcales bacterium]|nr:hypothetical protein [Myxococcales bacterium]
MNVPKLLVVALVCVPLVRRGVACAQEGAVSPEKAEAPASVRSCYELPLLRCLGPEARAAYVKGKASFGAQRYLEALQGFEEAYRLQPDPRLKWNRAATLVELGDHVQAARELDSLVEADAALPAHESLRADALRALEGLEKYVRTLKPVVSPPGASVHVDGAFVGTAPLERPIRLDQTRPHVLVVRAPGYDEHVFDLAISDPLPEQIALVPSGAVPGPGVPGLPAMAIAPPVERAAPGEPEAAGVTEARASSSSRALVWGGVGLLTLLAAAGAFVLLSRDAEPTEPDLGRVTLF